MNLAPYLAVRRARLVHAAAFYDDDAMESFLAEEHLTALRNLPPCRTNLDALAIVEEIKRVGAPDDMGVDRDALCDLLADFLRTAH